MRKVMSIMGVFILVGSFIFASASQSSQASPRKVDRKMIYKVEPTTQPQNITGESGIPVQHNNRNGFSSQLVDESMNGYGMIIAPTKPVFRDSDTDGDGPDDDFGVFFVYRQFAGDGATSGQIGASLCANCTDGTVESGTNGTAVWNTYYNLNDGMGAGRYPSALGTGDTPYAIWNEYTTQVATYGGRPYYAYDDFGWDGGLFTDPINTDSQWDVSKVFWVGSPAHSVDSEGMNHVNISYNDWTRGDSWLFHSEGYSDGFIVYGAALKVIDETADLVGLDV
jgi:hypothetical protein